jgi:uncharacterized membrane protein HdeD (DUF308 family)
LRAEEVIMRPVLVKNWWSLVFRGVLGIVFGLVALAWPGITLGALVLLFGAYALMAGIVSIVGAVRAAEAHDRWGALILEGLVGIAAAVITIAWPAITALALAYLIAGWAIVIGVLEIVVAVRLRKYISREWLLALGGAASTIFGILIAIAPIAGALVIAIWVGAYAFVFGLIMVALGFRLRSSRNAPQAGPSFPVPAH